MRELEQGLLALPIFNGILPRPGGTVTGVFLAPWLLPAVTKAGRGADLFLAPVDPDGLLYPVGIVAKVGEFWSQNVYIMGAEQPIASGVFLSLYGREQAKVRTYTTSGRSLLALGVQSMPVRGLRPEYPCISGAGWVPQGGHTETRGEGDITVCIEGIDAVNGDRLSLTGQLGGLVSYQQAHTIEHAIIRSLQSYAFCSPKTLREALIAESRELKASVEAGLKLQRPELFGVTASGACGNRLTHLAQFYLTDEYFRELQSGHPALASLDKARKRTLSRLTQDLSLTTDAGLRALQGLKNGMQHDDSRLGEEALKRVLMRFPSSPWG